MWQVYCSEYGRCFIVNMVGVLVFCSEYSRCIGVCSEVCFGSHYRETGIHLNICYFYTVDLSSCSEDDYDSDESEKDLRCVLPTLYLFCYFHLEPLIIFPSPSPLTSCHVIYSSPLSPLISCSLFSLHFVSSSFIFSLPHPFLSPLPSPPPFPLLSSPLCLPVPVYVLKPPNIEVPAWNSVY